MKSKTRKLLAVAAIPGSLFGFTGIAQAYEVYGKGVVYLDYSMTTSVPHSSHHNTTRRLNTRMVRPRHSGARMLPHAISHRHIPADFPSSISEPTSTEQRTLASDGLVGYSRPDQTSCLLICFSKGA